MSDRIVYLNGSWVPETEAKVSIFDRGMLMADAVYEVTAVLGGRLIDFPGHRARLSRSLSELKMGDPFPGDTLLELHREIVARNGVIDGAVYLQVSRGGTMDRDFAFPVPGTTAQTIVMFTQNKPGLAELPAALKGLKVISLPDLRWGRRDIKTVQLLYPSFAKTTAMEAGKDDAWLVEDGYVTEGTAANAYVVKGRTIVTRHLGNEILRGVTRTTLLRFASVAGFTIEERPFTVEEARDADEAFITSASSFVFPVVEIDDAPIGTGFPGPVVAELRRLYLEEARKAAL